MPSPPVERLLAYTRAITDLGSAQALLGWDQDVHMPAGAAEGRANAVSTIEREIHRKMADNRLGDLAREAGLSGDPLEQEIATYWLESHEDTLRLPESLAAELAEASSIGCSIWHDAKTFEDMLPSLERQVDLNKSFAGCYPEEKPYDALIDAYDPGLTQAFINLAFDHLRPELLELRRGARPSPAKKSFRAPKDKILQVNRLVARWMGYNFEQGHLSETEHPFMMPVSRTDVRIATNVRLNDPLYTLSSTIHEAGHALYEQNAGHGGTGLDECSSSALHESQSLFWEVMVGKSEPFWDRWLPTFNEELGVDYTRDAIIGDLRHYDPTNVIRLQAGDLDYSLHILLRYEVEKALFVHNMPVREMKDVFNPLCLNYFGRYPADDRREGILQDVHWPAGMFGYFPSYLIGISFSAQLYEAAPDRTSPTALLSYLGDRVHKHGGRYSFEELTDIHGGFDPRHYIDYLRGAYSL